MNYNIRYGVCCPKGNTVNNPVQGRAAAAARGLGKTAYCHCKLLLLLAAAALALQACELESEQYDAVNPTIFPKTARDAEALVAECYDMLNAGSWGDGAFNLGYTLGLQEYTSDIGECSNNHDDKVMLLYGRWRTTDSHYTMDSHVTTHWRYNKRISAMTLNIDRIGQIDMDETLKNRLIAELHCGRALMAFILYDFFGPVPLPDLETLKNPLEEKILPRATEEEMRTFIEDNLLAAINTPELPDVYKKGNAEYGRFSRGICHFVLLKFYMQTRQWAKAEAAGRELMNPKYGYDLVPEYKDIFTSENQKNVETIYSSTMLGGYQQHETGWFQGVLPPDYPGPAGLDGQKYNMFRLSWWFVHKFDKDDKRLQTIVTEYEGNTGTVHNEAADKQTSGYLEYGAIPLKYTDIVLATGPTSPIDYIIYRYADALTLLAEAIVKNGNAVTQEAIDLLNRVRTRALGKAKAYKPADITSMDDFINKLLWERAFEHYWEGCRRQDLIRNDKYVEQITYKATQLNETTNVAEYMYRFPIPTGIINEGKGVIEQNPGYE